ncbi:MAG: hypothetical protein ACRDYU_19385 [Actinomycetes bacterium]
MLGLEAYGRLGGGRADLVVHDSERVVDVLRAHVLPRWVLSRGRVVAETTSCTRFPLEEAELAAE